MSKEASQISYPDQLWAGTDHSFTLASEVHARVQAGIFSVAPAVDTKDEPQPHNFSLQGSIGVIAIKGPLVTSDHPYNKYMGVISYSEVRRALIYAASNPEVKGILLDINSGGGAVNELSDTGSLIQNIDKGLKPIYAFTDGDMASAAYWLGSSARKVYSSSTSTVGSIGVILTHKEYAKAFKEAGIGVTIVRAGKYKALLNQFEPMSDLSLEQAQNKLDAAYGIFLVHVADRRGVSVKVADEKMAQGREFFGQDAVTIGLSDGIESFDSVMGRFAKKIDTSANKANNPASFNRGPDMTKKALTEQDIAALASGAPITAALPGTAEPDAAAVAAAAALAAAEAEATAAAAAAAAATPKATEQEKETSKDVVAYLQTQVTAGQAEVLTLKMALTKSEEAVAAMKATHGDLLKIAARSTSHMKVALGLSAVDLSAMTAEQVLAEHAAASAQFTTKFKAGGVAAVSATEALKPSLADDPNRRARLNATRFAETTK